MQNNEISPEKAKIPVFSLEKVCVSPASGGAAVRERLLSTLFLIDKYQLTSRCGFVTPCKVHPYFLLGGHLKSTRFWQMALWLLETSSTPFAAAVFKGPERSCSRCSGPAAFHTPRLNRFAVASGKVAHLTTTMFEVDSAAWDSVTLVLVWRPENGCGSSLTEGEGGRRGGCELP